MRTFILAIIFSLFLISTSSACGNNHCQHYSYYPTYYPPAVVYPPVVSTPVVHSPVIVCYPRSYPSVVVYPRPYHYYTYSYQRMPHRYGGYHQSSVYFSGPRGNMSFSWRNSNHQKKNYGRK